MCPHGKRILTILEDANALHYMTAHRFGNGPIYWQEAKDLGLFPETEKLGPNEAGIYVVNEADRIVRAFINPADKTVIEIIEMSKQSGLRALQKISKKVEVKIPASPLAEDAMRSPQVSAAQNNSSLIV